MITDQELAQHPELLPFKQELEDLLQITQKQINNEIKHDQQLRTS